ncbi:FMN-binding protein [Actinophytocola sp.]|uniref:FMN-binding protein n=1 Tax=Actinophytocola sp. TaxID=1872138 RepID=UPI003899F5DF
MRKAPIIVALLFAGLAPLVRYHPDTPAPTVVAAPPAPGAPGTRTVDGAVEDTEFGPYQVRVTFSGSTITDVQIITEPGDGHSQRIASRAEPTLRSEALRAQSAHIDMVSGATVTSEAYARSLQAAIDANGS